MKYWALLRVNHWIKNFFIFVPLFFSGEILVTKELILSLHAFGIFCAVASGVYIVNDLLDQKQDQKHEQKRKRPIASGAVSSREAVVLAVALFGLSGFWIIRFMPEIASVVLAYLLLNILYSFTLKHIMIVDVLTISGFYVLRVLAGGMAAEIPISKWLILCVMAVTLFLILAKRKAEFRQAHQRRVLQFYSPKLIDHLLIIAAGFTLITYSLYTVLGTDSEKAVYSIFFVLLGLFRYLAIVDSPQGEAEYPEKIIVSDRTILASLVGWIVWMTFIFY